jgi:uncharacterized membrane protein YecN with MAPEG domain
MMLPITLTIAGAAALLNLWLGGRVSQMRRRHKVSIGDGGHPVVAARMRAHANFSEYTPLFVILLAAVELAVGSETWLWGVAILFILGRLAHPFGMDRPGANRLRVGGMVATWLALLGLALFAIAVPYFNRSRADGIQISPGRLSSSGGTKLNWASRQLRSGAPGQSAFRS